MRILGKVLMWIAGTIGVVFLLFYFGWQFLYPTYTHRYRLTIEIEADGKVHSGSSVIESSWRIPQPLSEGSWDNAARGQAVLVDLGLKGIILAAIYPEELSANQQGLRVTGASRLALRAIYGWRQHISSPTVAQAREISSARNRQALAADGMPMFIWLPHPSDPKSAVMLGAHDFASKIAPGVRLIGAWVEITRELPGGDLRGRFPWLARLGKPLQAGRGSIKATNFELFPETLLGDEQ